MDTRFHRNVSGHAALFPLHARRELNTGECSLPVQPSGSGFTRFCSSKMRTAASWGRAAFQRALRGKIFDLHQDFAHQVHISLHEE